MNRRGVELVHLGEGCLDCVRRFDSVVVRNPREEMMRSVGRANVMVHGVEHSAIGAIDRAEGASDIGLFVALEVRSVGVGVMQPGVGDKPRIVDQIGAYIEREYEHWTGCHSPPHKKCSHRQDSGG